MGCPGHPNRTRHPRRNRGYDRAGTAQGTRAREATIATTIRDLLVRLGVEADIKSVKAFDTSVRTVAKSLAALSAVGIAALGGLAAIATSTARTGDEAAKAAKRLQLTTAEYQELDFAAQRSGASSEQLSVALKTLARQAFDAARGAGEGMVAFERLGISVTDAEGQTRSITDLFAEAADKLRGLDNEADKIALAQKLFGEGGTALLPLLEEGSAGIDELRRQARDLGFVLDEQASRDAEAFQDSMLDAGLAVQGLKTSIGAELLPIGIDLIEWFTDAVKAARPLVKWVLDTIDSTIGLRAALALLVGGVAAVSAAAAAAAGVLGFGALFSAVSTLAAAVPVVLSALSTFAGFLVAAGLPAVALAAAGIALLTAQVAAVAAGFVAAFLVLEDFVTFLTGGRSVVGLFVDEFAESEGPLGAFAQLFVSIRDLLSSVLGLARALGTAFLSAVIPAVNSAVTALEPLLSAIGSLVSLLARAELQNLSNLAGLVGSGVSALTGAVNAATSSITTNNISNTVNAPITSTAGAGETASAVQSAMQDMFRRAHADVIAVEG